MTKVHKVVYFREVKMETYIEAMSMDEALEKFYSSDHDAGTMVRDSEIHDELLCIEETGIIKENFLH